MSQLRKSGEVRDWNAMREMMIQVLERRTGLDLATWNERVRERTFPDEQSLSEWLGHQGVTGYARSLLVMERFGYPDFLLASGRELIDAQYADRQQLRPIYEAIVDEARRAGDVTVQARKTYVSLVSPQRTFARIRATTKDRLDLGLLVIGAKPSGRWRSPRIHNSLSVEIGFSRLSEFDRSARAILRRAYSDNS